MSENKIKHDDLDLVEVEQLHKAVLQMSNSCFEYKKICVGLLGAAIAFIVKFSENSVEPALVTVSLFIVISFWLADSTAYYYQLATRVRMNSIKKSIAMRNGIEAYEGKILKNSAFIALFNWSMMLYYSIIMAIIFSWFLV